jgi:8-oxo-dGTP pyrophosphatase MutT (NUDIX family)
MAGSNGRCQDCTLEDNSANMTSKWKEPKVAGVSSKTMTVREVSAGGVVVRRIRGKWHVAIVEPNTLNHDGNTPPPSSVTKPRVLALPKGGVNHGEKTEQAAEREILEETGLEVDRLCKLSDVHYAYTRSWGGRERVFKTVTFYLFRYRKGRIGDITKEMQIEVRRCKWCPLDQASNLLTYRGERDIIRLAQQYIRTSSELGGTDR